MVRIQSEIKRGFLRQLCAGAKKTKSTLGEVLMSFQANVINQPSFQRGKILISTSGSGQHSSFEMGVSGKQFTPENVAAMSEEFLTLLTVAIASPLSDDGQDASTDALFAYMSQDDLMNAVTEQRGDWSNLNTYATGTAAGAPA